MPITYFTEERRFLTTIKGVIKKETGNIEFEAPHTHGDYTTTNNVLYYTRPNEAVMHLCMIAPGLKKVVTADTSLLIGSSHDNALYNSLPYGEMARGSVRFFETIPLFSSAASRKFRLRIEREGKQTSDVPCTFYIVTFR